MTVTIGESPETVAFLLLLLRLTREPALMAKGDSLLAAYAECLDTVYGEAEETPTIH